MASSYVDTAAEEGRFHGHSTTPTGGPAASPKTMRRSWSSASSTHSHGHGAAPKCVCAPATHAGSFKCRLHRTSSHGHGHPPSPPSTTAASAAPPPAVLPHRRGAVVTAPAGFFHPRNAAGPAQPSSG